MGAVRAGGPVQAVEPGLEPSNHRLYLRRYVYGDVQLCEQ